MKKTIKFSLITVLVILVVAEVFFRMYYREELKDQASPLIFQPDSTIAYRHIPSSEGFLSKPGIAKRHVKINTHGLYNTEVRQEKEPGTTRIAVVGASFATGIYMDGEKNYSVQLQDLFNKTATKVEVINFSMDGLGRGLANLKILESDMLAYQPDLILFEMSFPLSIGAMERDVYKDYLITYTNDSTRTIAKGMVDELEDMEMFKFFYNCSYIYRAFCRAEINDFWKSHRATLMRVYRDKIARGNEMEEHYMSTATTMELLKTAQDLAQQHGAKLIHVSYYLEKNNLSDYFNQHGVHSLFLNLKFEPKNISHPDSHINESGHAMIANALFDSLTRNNFFLEP
ncbi:SGNH/GDSL hydrolase family protein [Sphingobacterium paludis]|nr:SGNH/GDSL hydrolase family protein [Sphingobacterium paludis]